LTRELWNLVPEYWRAHLETCHDEISEISKELDAASNRGEVCVPARGNIFAVLNLSPEQVKVVILGQDPYPNVNHANGFAFAVPAETNRLPGSLRNIFKEVDSDLAHTHVADPDLRHWASQGVLLLNTSLTTLAGASNSHPHLPWDVVTSQILKVVVAANPQVVAILWGKTAQKYAPLFGSGQVLMSAHPSPLSAHRGFFGSRPFSKANELLSLNKQKRINW
jgi:uracil-DNA glycosylase